MELSLRLSHFPCSSSSYSSLHHPCELRTLSSPKYTSKKQQRVSVGSSNRPLASHHGFLFGCGHLKQPNQSFSRTYGLPHETICVTRRHCCPTPISLYCNDELGKTCNARECDRRRKSSRDVVVRSELTGTGSAGASFPLSKIWLNSKVRAICFYVTTACAALALFLPMVLVHLNVLRTDPYRRKIHYLVAMCWAKLSVSPFVDIEYEGRENLPDMDTPAVYVSNHQSFLDIYCLLTLSRSFKFISKTSVFLYPIIGWAMFLLGVIPLKRMDSRSQLDCLKRCMFLIKMGASVFFFPEGTRSKDGNLGPFKKGAFSVAVKTGVPVVPITLIGTGRIMPAGKEGTLNPGSVKIIIHPPIVGNNPEELSNEARNIIANDLVRHG